MAETLQKVVLDCSTGKRTIIPLTAEEISQREQMAQEAETRRQAEEAEAQAKADAKASAISKLTALGLTEDEALALVGQ